MNAYELANELAFKHIAGDESGAFSSKIIDTLRQQQAEIEALKDFAIWMTGCGYDFCQHEYFIKCRDELLVGKVDK
jgi:hypothetical protein